MNSEQMRKHFEYLTSLRMQHAEATIELAKRLGLNPEYVESATYVPGDPEDGAQPHISVTMHNFVVHLPKDFDLDDEDHQLPDMSLDLAKATAGACLCYSQVTDHSYSDTVREYQCGNCSVEIER